MTSAHLEALGQACIVGQLIYSTVNLHCIVLDLVGVEVYAIPDNHLKNCDCLQLNQLSGSEVDVKSLYMMCKRACDMGVYQTVSWYFGISSIIIPIRKGSEHIASLVIGPVMTEDPEDILRAQSRFRPRLKTNSLTALKKTMATLEQQDKSHIDALIQIVFSLLNNNTGDTKGYLADIGRLEGVEICLNEYPEAVKAAVCYISSNYMNNISLNDVAQSASVHPTYLSRLFHQYTNCSFREYINRLRVAKARHLLLDTSKSILSISREVGFFDQSYFNRIFKI